jgi:four helix bundle protein
MDQGRELAVEVYRVTAGFPSEERFGLTSQLRRAAVSVVANIAEGAGRTGNREYHRFVSIACGSTAALEALLDLAELLGMASPDHFVRARPGSSQTKSAAS